MNTIKKMSMTLAVTALAVVICFSAVGEVTEAETADFGTITYDSINGFHIHFNDDITTTGVMIETDYGGTSVPVDGRDVYINLAGIEAGPCVVQVMLIGVDGQTNVEMTMTEMTFDPNGGGASRTTVIMSSGENVIPSFDWERDGQKIIGWSTDRNDTEPDYGLDGIYNVPSSETTLYAVYGDASVTEEVTITVTGNGANVTADGIVGGTITAEVGTELTFDVQAQDGYTLEGATYTYNGHTIQIDGDSFTIEVVKGANTLVVDAEQEQPVEEPVTVNIDSTGAQVTYNDETVDDSLQLVPGTDATFGISAQTGYTMEGCTVTYNGDPVEVTDGEFTITVAENGGTIVIILQDVDPEPKPEVLDGIEVTGYRVQYQVGETFSTHGMSVTAVYKSGDTERRVPVDIADCDFQPGLDVPFGAVGPATVTVTYDDGTESVSCSIEVQVVPAPEPPCTITVTQPENGTITPSSGSVAVGNTFTYTVRADFGWRIVSVTANGETIDVDGVSYSGSFVVSADASVTAEIVSDATGTVTVTAGDHGSIGAGGATSAPVTVYGHWSTTVTIDPDNGYRVSGISHDGAENSVTYEDGVLTIAAGSDVTKIDIAFEQIPVSDDDDEYVPPVITVIPGDDDDSTTYIVAIAAAAVVAILAALILMQTRKS